MVHRTNRTKSLKLWPHDKTAVDIDLDYYDNLPFTEYIDGVKEYVRMFPDFTPPYRWKPYDMDGDSIIHLVSEWLETEEEAEHFARAVEKHCYGITKAVGNIVYGDFHVYSVSANWRDELMGFVFANWS